MNQVPIQSCKPTMKGYVKFAIQVGFIDEDTGAREDGGVAFNRRGQAAFLLERTGAGYSYVGRVFFLNNIPRAYKRDFTELYEIHGVEPTRRFLAGLDKSRHQPVRVLELCCGAGGGTRGILRANHAARITGVDIERQPHFPVGGNVVFLQQDVLTLEQDFISSFDLVLAYPPCQAYSKASAPFKHRIMYPDLVATLRNLLLDAGKPFVIENVPGAPVRKDLELCGCMFSGLNVLRARHFEIHGFTCPQPLHVARFHHKKTIASGGPIETVFGKRGPPGPNGKQRWMNAMSLAPMNELFLAGNTGMGVSSFKGLSQAIPPQYTEYIMNCFTGCVQPMALDQFLQIERREGGSRE